MESAATGGAAHPPGACDPPQNCGGYMSLVGRWEEAKFPAGINLVQTMAPGWRQIVSEVALDLITIPAVSALHSPGDGGVHQAEVARRQVSLPRAHQVCSIYF